MAVSTDITNILSSDKKPTFRELLKSLINNSGVSSILIGENHDDHLIEDLVLANLDVLAKSRRQVVLIFENLNQKENEGFSKASEKVKKELKKSDNPLKKIEVLKEKTVQFFTAVLGAVTHNVAVQGAENNISNPFSSVKDSQMSLDILRAMEKFQKSPDRILKTNEEFASLVDQYCTEDTLPIFIGGAAHPITLYQNGKVYDLGLQGRVKNSVSIYLLESAESSFQASSTYSHVERNLQGTYDYQIITNKKTLYKDTFDNLPQLMDKISFLTNTLDNLIKGHLWFAKNGTSSLPEEANSILLAFQESIEENVKFSSFEELLNEIIVTKSLKEPSQPFFIPKTSKTPGYCKESCVTAIYHDLASVIRDEVNEKITFK